MPSVWTFSLLLVVTLSVLDGASARNLRSIGSTAAKEHLTEDEEIELSYCGDTKGTFLAAGEDEEHDCAWLKDNFETKASLCNQHAVSSTCRKVCDVCEDTLRATELLSSCANEQGDVEVTPGSGIWISCDWLSDHEDQMPEACMATSVALFCPVVCDTFHLGPCILFDPHPDNR